jgi:hypothetical protein
VHVIALSPQESHRFQTVARDMQIDGRFSDMKTFLGQANVATVIFNQQNIHDQNMGAGMPLAYT